MRFLLLIPLMALTACSPEMRPNDMSEHRTERRSSRSITALPPMKLFAHSNVTPPNRSNREIARDFLDLSFAMESGRILPIMTRFEGPITLRVTGKIPASLGPDLKHLLSRLNTEAGIPIRRVPASSAANITINVIPRAQLQRFVPQAACFVVPRISSWAQYRKLRHTSQTNWTDLQSRNKIAIFLPGDVSPQEVRDCLHEELAQALGPLNDLYRLPDSVFNDDNFQTVLTGFDMLILRAYYAPEMHNGMTRNQAASVLPQLLARLNPRGQQIATRPFTAPTSRTWINAIEAAFDAQDTPAVRRKAAQKAVAIAQEAGWNDTRLAYSLFTLGGLSLTEKNDAALRAFLNSGAIYNNRETSVQAAHVAHVALQLAAFSLSIGDGAATLKLVNASLPAVANSKNAVLLATLLMVKAEALDLVGRASEAHSVRLDSLGWARYGFGSDKAVRARLAEISALTPRRTSKSMRDL